MFDESSIEISILKALEEKYPTHLTYGELTEKCNETIDDITRAAEYLSEHGYIEVVKTIGNSLPWHAKIVAPGIDIVKGRATPPSGIHQTVTINDSQVGHIVALGNAAGDVNNVQIFLTRLEAEVKAADIPDDKKSSILDSIKNLSSHPAFLVILGKLIAGDG